MGYSPSPKKIWYFLCQILHLHTFLKEIKLVEKVDFPQYIIIWYIDNYVFVQGLDDFSSWWFLTRFQFCFSDISHAALIFRALSDYQLYSLYNQLQTYHSACETRYTLYIQCTIPLSTYFNQGLPFSHSGKYFLARLSLSYISLVLSNFLFFFSD